MWGGYGFFKNLELIKDNHLYFLALRHVCLGLGLEFDDPQWLKLLLNQAMVMVTKDQKQLGDEGRQDKECFCRTVDVIVLGRDAGVHVLLNSLKTRGY